MRTLLTFLSVLLTTFSVSGQNVFDLDTLADAQTMAARLNQGIYFSYDASGNRTSSQPPVSPLRESHDDGQQLQSPQHVFAEFCAGPSPTDGEVTVCLIHPDGQTAFTVTIYNTSGQPVATSSTTAASVTLNITSQPKGVYIVEIVLNGQSQTTKITKK